MTERSLTTDAATNLRRLWIARQQPQVPVYDGFDVACAFLGGCLLTLLLLVVA